MNLEISTDPARLDIDCIHHFLAKESYWGQGIPREVVARAVANSLCFGAYLGDEQVGLARVITDRATFAYLSDVFVLETYRGRGYGKALMATVMAHPDLQDMRTMLLFTRDAHTLYAPHGFSAPPDPTRIMVRRIPTSYQSALWPAGD